MATIDVLAPAAVGDRSYARTHAPVVPASNEDVEYVDEQGNSKTASSAIQITAQSKAGAEKLATAWYYAEGTTVSLGSLAIDSGIDAKLILKDGCDLALASSVLGSGSLTVYGQSLGNGKLTVKGVTVGYPVIGVNNLTINGGEIITQPSVNDMPGIGRGKSGVAAKLTINRGTVRATGSVLAAGIDSDDEVDGLSVTINGGTVIATGGNYAAGIGGHQAHNGGSVTINGGTVTATGGEYSAGISGGEGGDGGSVTITGGTVTATGGKGAAGIGGGKYGDGGLVTISGGMVIAKGGELGSGIGGGNKTGDIGGWGGIVVISGGSVVATHGSGSDNIDDIGKGFNGKDGNLTDGADNNVYLNTITVGGNAAANAPVTKAVIGGVSSYGVKDVTTDGNGKVYLYLPSSAGEEVVGLTVGGEVYEGKYTRSASHDNAQVLASCTSAGLSQDTGTGKCVAPDDGADGDGADADGDAAAQLKRTLALAVIVAVMAWLM